uniref:Uncharacterized protein n=1 Tax=Anguilla anguilla TaxID=7936 RepID=A0A0E9VCY8_ANGAN
MEVKYPRTFALSQDWKGKFRPLKLQ